MEHLERNIKDLYKEILSCEISSGSETLSTENLDIVCSFYNGYRPSIHIFLRNIVAKRIFKIGSWTNDWLGKPKIEMEVYEERLLFEIYKGMLKLTDRMHERVLERQRNEATEKLRLEAEIRRIVKENGK